MVVVALQRGDQTYQPGGAGRGYPPSNVVVPLELVVPKTC